MTALRLDQAVFGALTALLVLLWLRRVAPREPLVAIAGGALMAVQLGHVLVSRTGWGQAACTFFLMWMIAIAWRMYAEAGERDTRALLRGALGITLTSLAAYGFHEMATVYTFVLALFVALLFSSGPDGVRLAPWRSRRVAFGLAGCIPVGALTVGLLFFSEFARAKWFSSSLDATYGWWQRRELAFTYLLDVVALPRQVSFPVIGLAVLGLAGALTRDAKWLVWLVAWATVPTLLLFLRFNFPELARIYLPVDVILVVLAAEGLGVLWTVARGRAGRALADGTAALAVVWCGLVTWSTIFVGPEAPLHVAAVHHPLPEGAHPAGTFDDIAITLRGSEITEPVAVAFVWGPLFRILDLGIPAEIVELDALPEGSPPPRLVVAPRRSMEAGGRMRAQGGPYELAARDRYDHPRALRQAALRRPPAPHRQDRSVQLAGGGTGGPAPPRTPIAKFTRIPPAPLRPAPGSAYHLLHEEGPLGIARRRAARAGGRGRPAGRHRHPRALPRRGRPPTPGLLRVSLRPRWPAADPPAPRRQAALAWVLVQQLLQPPRRRRGRGRRGPAARGRRAGRLGPDPTDPRLRVPAPLTGTWGPNTRWSRSSSVGWSPATSDRTPRRSRTSGSSTPASSTGRSRMESGSRPGFSSPGRWCAGPPPTSPRHTPSTLLPRKPASGQHDVTEGRSAAGLEGGHRDRDSVAPAPDANGGPAAGVPGRREQPTEFTAGGR